MVFVITGGSSGIGAATAAVAAESGARVVIGSRNAERGNEVVREIAEGGGQAVFQQSDVTVEEDVRTLMKGATDAYGGIDVLVCNAGVTDRAVAAQSDLEHMDVADFRRVLETGEALRCLKRHLARTVYRLLRALDEENTTSVNTTAATLALT